jgi:hypothetical protein
MPGGLIQLAVYGGQDYYFTSNPQISFFKSVYRRYTNFSMELINLVPTMENRPLSLTQETIVTFTINRHGDLMKDSYFVFTLPDIYSDATYNFQWIKRIGEYIIKEVSFNVGSRKIDTHYCEWLHIWSELTTDAAKIQGYYDMIGNVPELYDPAAANTNGGTYPVGTAVLPSIRGRRIYVPLRFWFNENYGAAFPLIAMQYDSEPTIVLRLRPILELYTITDPLNNNYRVAPSPNNPNHNIGNFLAYNSSNQSVSSLDIIPNMEVNYIFLDRDERKRFALSEHEYLIRQVQIVRDQFIPGTFNNDTRTLELKIQHPVASLYWFLRRSDLEQANQWYNFTNWPDPAKPPYYYPTTYNPFGADPTITQPNYTAITEKNLVQSGALLLNGINRFDAKSYEFFNLLNSFQHQQRISPDNGIYSYSFALENEAGKYQPSGTCNMSRFNKVQLQLGVLQSPQGATYDFRINVFVVNYNVFRILGGLGDVEFSS